MNIGLFFGSFNPIHTGHLIIANHLRQQSTLDQVWFVVSPQNPFKQEGLLNEYHRFALVQLGIGDEPGLRAMDIEFRLPKPSYTIDTLTYLQEKYPENKFVVIMGGDSYSNLPKWKNFDRLIANWDLIVYPRPGFSSQEPHPNSRTLFAKAPFLEISATHIRKLIQEGKSIRFLVPDNVKDEIEKNGYYK